MSHPSEPAPQPANPEVDPSRGTAPKCFPAEPTPRDRQEAAPSASQANDPETSKSRLGSGEDPDVESGTDKNDPEQQAAGADDEVEKSYE